MKKLQLILLLIVILNFGNYGCTQKETSLISKGAQLTKVADGFSFTEGPAADKNGNVYFTDQPNDQILKWQASDNSIEVFKSPSGRANGLYFDNSENLLAAADENNELWRINKSGLVDTLLSEFQGKKLNGPNDLWVDSKGGIYFTDPYYQRPWWTRTAPDIPEQNVYYVSPNSNKILVVANDLIKPNGIIGSLDGKKLYIADIGDNKTYSYQINDDGTLSEKQLFTNLGSDGMTIDTMGNVYLTGEGVSVYNDKGDFIMNIPVKEKWTANVTFGGPNQDILFITAMGAVYTLKMNIKGIRYQ